MPLRLFKLMFFAFALLAIGALPSNAQSANANEAAEAVILPDAEVAAIRRVFDESTKALLAEDWDARSEMWATDVVMMPPNHPPVVGLRNVRKFILDGFSGLKDFKQSDWVIEGAENLAVVTTTMEWTPKEGVTKTGSKVVIMVKDAEGLWRVYRVIYNLNNAP